MKILIVSPSWIGDAVMAQCLFKIIKQEQPDCRLEVLAPRWPLPLFSRMKEINSSILSPFEHGELNIKGRYNLGIAIRSKKFDRAIVMTNSYKSALVPFFARIPERSGWIGELRYGLINDVRKDNSKYTQLMIERFSALFLDSKDISVRNIPLPSLTADEKNTDKILSANNINRSNKTIVFCPGAEFGMVKRWPTYRFSVVVQHYLNLGWNAILLGSKKDSNIATEIIEPLAKNHSGLFDLTGKTSIQDALDILSVSDLALTNDSGLMHVAAAVGTPLVALYGPTSPEYTPPLGPLCKVIKKNSGFSKTRVGDRHDGYHSSLFEISPEEVIETLNGNV